MLVLVCVYIYIEDKVDAHFSEIKSFIDASFNMILGEIRSLQQDVSKNQDVEASNVSFNSEFG